MGFITGSLIFYLVVLAFALWFYKTITTVLYAVAIKEGNTVANLFALILGTGLIFINPLALMLAVQRIAAEANLTLDLSYWVYFVVMLFVNILLSNVTQDAKNVAENL